MSKKQSEVSNQTEVKKANTDKKQSPALIPAYRDTFIHFLFATPGNEDILLDFLNSVLENDDQKQVKSVKPSNPFNPQTFVTDKYTILDVKATDDTGGIFVVEFQSWEHAAFENRMLYYCCKSFCLQIGEGEEYTVLKLVIGIAIVAYPLKDKELPDVHNSFRLTAKKNPKRVFADGSGIEIHTLEVIDEKEDLFSELKPRLRSWANFFHYADKKSEAEMTALLDNPVTGRAYEKYKQFNQDEKMRALDNAHQQYLHDYATDVGTAHRKGKAEGLAEGEAKGKAEIALAMKSKGFTLSDIANITGLSTSEIEGLSQQ
ncbi:hypothetical protein FACS18942_04820 [Planctomycetales bacterium]|nr:hypothetical protein FACS18942_04820 [Planctomycetales bacterium]GHT34965.1 hypothetical protein FACS189427_03280 [Planctomycetales bacterium]